VRDRLGGGRTVVPTRGGGAARGVPLKMALTWQDSHAGRDAAEELESGCQVIEGGDRGTQAAGQQSKGRAQRRQPPTRAAGPRWRRT